MELKNSVPKLKYISISLLFIFSACKGDAGLIGPQGDDGLPGPKLSGSISGYISLKNVNDKPLSPSTSASVIVEGTNKIANCDSTGRWIIDSLETGTYNLIFQMAGFGSYIKKSFQFVGGSDFFYGRVTLAKIPDFYVQSITTGYDYGLNEFVINGNTSITAQGDYLTILVFAGVDSTVSSNPEQYLQSSYGFVYPHENNFSITIPSQQILNLGVKKGSQVYFRAYGCSSMTILSPGTVEGANYIDPKTGRTVHTSISLQASPVTNMTIL